MGTQALRRKFQSLRRCEVCHRPKNELYQLDFDEFKLLACSGICAERARANYQEKKDKGIEPGQPIIEDSTPDVLEDNI